MSKDNIPKSIKSYIIEKKTYKLSNMTLYTATNRDINEKVLIHIFPKERTKSNPNEVTLMNNHVFLMKLLNHKNILKLYEIIETNTHSFLIFEYFKGMKLSDYISLKKELKEGEAMSIFKEILSTLVYLHDMYLCNLNINANNIIIDSLNNIKFCDFEFGHFYTSSEIYRMNLIGDHKSTCPEVHSKKPYNPELADIWSCGVLLYQMLTNHLPFEAEKDLEAIRMIIKGDYSMPKNISKEMEKLLKGLLEKEEDKRLKINDLFTQPILEDKNITKASLTQGLNVLTTKFPIDPIVLNLCENIFKIDPKQLTKDLESNTFTPQTSLFNQVVTKLKNKNIKTINDLCSNKFILYLNNHENYLNEEKQIENIKNYLLKEDEIKKNSQDITNILLNNYIEVSNGLDQLKSQFKKEKKGIQINARRSSFDIVKKIHRGYKLEDPMEEVEIDFEDSNNNLNYNKSLSQNMDFHMMKRNTVVLQNLKGLDINKIVNMVVENNKKPGGRFKNTKNNMNAIEEIYEERSDSENSRSDSEESRITKIRQTLTNINNIEELKELIKELQLKNDELQKSLDNTNFKLLKKESEIEEKSIKAEKNKNQRAELQILKTKNEKILKEKDNEIIELKRQLQEKEGKGNIKNDEGKNSEINKKLNNEIEDLKKKLEGKDNEINNLKKNLEEKENEIKKIKEETDSENNKKSVEKDNEINDLKKKLEGKESENTTKKDEVKNDNEINELKVKLNEKENEIKTKLEEKDKEITELKKKLEEKELQANNEVVSEKKEDNNNEEKDKEIIELKKNFEEKDNEINDLKKKLEEKESQIELTKKSDPNSNEEKSEEILKLKNELDENKKMVEKLKKEVMDLEASKNNEIKSVETSDKNGENDAKQLEEELIKVRAELSQTKCQLAESVYQKEMLETKYKRYTEKLEGKLASLGLKLKIKFK